MRSKVKRQSAYEPLRDEFLFHDLLDRSLDVTDRGVKRKQALVFEQRVLHIRSVGGTSVRRFRKPLIERPLNGQAIWLFGLSFLE